MDIQKEKLVLDNIDYAKALARRFCGNAKGPDRQDVESAAFEGLTIAATEYDPSRGTQFQTLAFWWIRKKIFMEIDFLSQHGKSLGEYQDFREDVFNELVRTVEVDKLNAAIQLLSPTEEYIINYFFMYGIQMKEIARELGVPVSTAFWRKNIALKKLRELLK